MQIADYKEESYSFGRSKKFVLWLQGCHQNCINCISPEWKSLESGRIISNTEILDKIVQSNSNAVVISGGEPLLQYQELTEFLVSLNNRRIHVILFTGLSWYKVKKQYSKILNLVDVLITGKYIEKKNNNLGIRGSSNQKVISLTPHFDSEMNDFLYGKRLVEITINKDAILYCGIPPKNLGDI